MPQNTYLPDIRKAGAERRWHLIDAKGQVLGRMATRTANLLRGKHKPTYTDFVDGGDFVVITNAAQVRLTGNKINQKFYFSHSGWAGGAKTTPIKRVMEKDPRKVVYLAVKRMIRNNRLRGKQMARLKIYPGDKHPHGGKALQGATSEK
jgi:large subunit ribosomal protein L13